MDKLGDIRRICHDKMLSARSINRIVQTEDFSNNFEKSSVCEQDQITMLILNGDKDGVDSWMNSKRDYAALSIKELRQIAQKLGVHQYSLLPKGLLVTGIEDVEKSLRQDSDETDVKHDS